MTDKIKELLAVLDMPEEEQAHWLGGYGHIPPDLQKLWFQKGLPTKTLLADLAFRLRDEAINLECKISNIELPEFGLTKEHGCWTIAKTLTAATSQEETESFLLLVGNDRFARERLTDGWFTKWSQPIDWVIAALIAKELSKNEASSS